MRIGIILDQTIKSGGGFYQSVNAIFQFIKLCKDEFDVVVYTTHLESIATLAVTGIKAKYLKLTVIDRHFHLLATSSIFVNYQRIMKLIAPFERSLIADQVDIIYFLSPTVLALCLQKLNYIFTVWDLCHRDNPEFPEVHEFGEFERREMIYSRCIAKSLLCIVDSEKLVERIMHRYGIDKERLLAIPFSPSYSVTENIISLETDTCILERYGLEPGYLFYPAQFWAHKNHVRILQALKQLNERGRVVQLVLTGGDQGNRLHVENTATELNVRSQVHFLGFIPSKDIPTLYRNSLALVMPTYFGPTNLPPLEAWAMEIPIIYPNIFRDFGDDAALYFDIEDQISLMLSIEQVFDMSMRRLLIKNGKRRLCAKQYFSTCCTVLDK